ncbi:hypothetical protein C8R43DRAFT_1001532 [Mycena crocata]|nr:hypothetical protein C8R43DRAFT_1001532 [Mycena crocata]
MTSIKTASCFMGIHKAPAHLTREEFEAKADALGNAIAALPIAQKCLLKLDIISQNTLMDNHMKSVGLPTPAPTVVMSAEYESLDHLDALLRDPALQKLFAEADDFDFRKNATAFAADIITKIEGPGSGTTAHTNVICIYHCPPNMSSHEFGKKMEDVMDRITALPIARLILSYTLWLQNDAVDKHLQELKYAMPQPLLVVRADTEDLERMMELFEHSEVSQLLNDGLRHIGYHRDCEDPVESCVFSADVSTKINNY